MKKTVLRYVTLNPFDVNDDVIFLFTFYKHRRKQICAAILKPNIEVTSSTRYLYEIRKFCEQCYARKNLRTQNLRTEMAYELS